MPRRRVIPRFLGIQNDRDFADLQKYASAEKTNSSATREEITFPSVLGLNMREYSEHMQFIRLDLDVWANKDAVTRPES